MPKITTAIFGLGAHDLQPRHLVAAFKNMEGRNAPFVYLGSQFFTKTQFPRITALQDRLKAAYPETEFMALETEANPRLLPPSAFRIRFHSVGGYGTIATGKLLTDILAGVLEMRSKAAPKYGSEKSGAPTNYYITLSPDPVLITNAELEDVEIVISPDHKVFSHTNPLKGLVEGGSFILQTRLEPLEAWREMPQWARKTIREKNIRFFVVDGFAVAKRHAPTPDLETRMMGIAFIGALCGHVDRVKSGASQDALLTKIRDQISYKFGAKGGAVVDGNMAVIREGLEATKAVDYSKPEYLAAETAVKAAGAGRGVAISVAASGANRAASCNGLFDRDYYDETVASAFRDGSIAEAPVLPGTGMFMPAATSAWKDKGLFRRDAPLFNAQDCTGCMECTLVCPDAAIPNAVHDIDALLHTAIGMLELDGAQREQLHGARAAAKRARARCLRQEQEGPETVPRDRRRGGVGIGPGGQPAARENRRHGPSAGRLSRRENQAVLQRLREGGAGWRRPVRRQHRPVEVHGLPRMRRGLRTGRAHRAAAGRRHARSDAGPLRVLQPHAEHAGAFP